MLRNNLKSLEGTIASNTIVRCHRSYMVNLQNVKMINYEKDGLYITFNTNAISRIPISKSYAEEVMKRFSDL